MSAATSAGAVTAVRCGAEGVDCGDETGDGAAGVFGVKSDDEESGVFFVGIRYELDARPWRFFERPTDFDRERLERRIERKISAIPVESCLTEPPKPHARNMGDSFDNVHLVFVRLTDTIYDDRQRENLMNCQLRLRRLNRPWIRLETSTNVVEIFAAARGFRTLLRRVQRWLILLMEKKASKEGASIEVGWHGVAATKRPSRAPMISL